MRTEKADIYTRVTNRIIEALEVGTRPWLTPWETKGGGAFGLPQRSNGVAYRGVNVLLLWWEAAERGYSSHLWMTYKQAGERGAHVRKGEKGTTVVYFDRASKTETNEKGEEVDASYAFLKSYTVFNVEQIDGLPEVLDEGDEIREVITPIEAAETFFANTGAEIRHGGNRAFYSPLADVIQLPKVDAFRTAEGYSSTKAHELIHWTGHKSRLDREFGKRFADKAYAFEELVAELGAAFLCAGIGVAAEPREDHASYIAHWLEVLKADKRAIFTAAAIAQKATDYLDGLQPSEHAYEAAELLSA
ncbi:MAG TPA: zincin-like metallopeptidase domain-containing protein [Burkholderiales bacterium]|jgi:antirestriction protein ArdC